MPTKYTGDKECEQALSACIALIRASENVQARLADSLQDSGITLPQWTTLDCLYWGGPMKSRDIARTLQRSDGNISYILDKLEAAGLVERCRSEADRRQLKVALSPAGRTLYSELLPGLVGRITALFSGLSGKEQQLLQRLAATLGRSARQADRE